jgi:hypothetical protein
LPNAGTYFIKIALINGFSVRESALTVKAIRLGLSMFKQEMDYPYKTDFHLIMQLMRRMRRTKIVNRIMPLNKSKLSIFNKLRKTRIQMKKKKLNNDLSF